MNRHDVIVARSRALHQAIAARIRAHPEMMQIVRANVERWLGQEHEKGVASPALLEWKNILKSQSVEQVLELICTETEEADRLRHSTPFCGILTEQERSAIFQSYAAVPA